MKGVSETISTMIIFGTVIMVSLTIFYFAISSLKEATLSAEYGYLKSVFLGIADNFPDIIQGGTYASRLPSELVGVGYRVLIDKYVDIAVINDSVTIINYTDTPIALHASTHASLIVSERIVYGVNDYIVNETLLLPRIREYFLNGQTHLELDTVRFYVKIYVYETETSKTYIVNLIYAKLTVKIASSKPVQVTVSLGKDLLKERLVDIDDLRLTVRDGAITYTATLADLIPSLEPGSEVVVNLAVKNILVVLS